MLYQILVYTIQGKKSYKDDKFNVSAPTWNDKFELAVGSCSVLIIIRYSRIFWLLYQKTWNTDF